MTLQELNKLPFEDCCKELQQCCTSTDWIVGLAEKRPFLSTEDLMNKSELVWHKVDYDGWLEACEGHPKIGDVTSLKEKYANTKEMAGDEQKGMDTALPQTIEKLAKYNSDYETKFGYIFIVCATGKSASEMSDILETRLFNEAEAELKIAMAEQNKITVLRLKKLLS